KSGAPTKINGLAASRFEGKPSYVQRCRCLPIAKVRHDGGEVGSRDDVEQFLFLDRKPWPHFPQAVDRIDVGDDRVMAGAFESLVVEGAACAPADDRLRRHGDSTEKLTYLLQSGHDHRDVRYEVLRQIANLGAGISDDLLALTVIKFLRDLQRLGCRPSEAGRAQFLQRGQIVQLGRPLALVFDAYRKRALEVSGRVGDAFGNFATKNPFLWSMSHLELAARDLGCGDDFKISNGNEVADFQLTFADDRQSGRLHTTDPDHTPSPFAEDDGSRAGERQIVDLIGLAARNGGCIKARIFGIGFGSSERITDGLGILRGEQDPHDLAAIIVMLEDLLTDELSLPIAIGSEPDAFGGAQRFANGLELGGLVAAIGRARPIQPFGAQQDRRPALPFGNYILRFLQIEQMPFRGQNLAVARTNC